MRLIDLEKDYDTLVEWWTSYDFPPVPKECLPKHGLIIEGVCAGFVYRTDSKIAWLEWIVGNRQVTKEVREEGLQRLVPALTELAGELGYEKVFSAVKHPNLIQIYIKQGFITTDNEMQHFIGNTGSI